MRSIIIEESALRDILRETLGSPQTNSHLSPDSPVRVNPVVSPDAPEVDPTNTSFVPKNKNELLSALRVLCDVDDDDASGIYIAIKDTLEKQQGEKMSDDKKKVEESIRAEIKKILKEISAYEKRKAAADKLWAQNPPIDPSTLPPVKKIPAGVSGVGGVGAERKAKFEKNKEQLKKTFEKMVDVDDEPEQTPVGRKNVMMSDVGGASFKDIAKELGFAAESGAKQAVEKALSKAKFTSELEYFDPDTLEILILQSMADYVDMLQSTGELTAEEVKLLKANPAIVRELDGFREFLDKDIRRARRTAETSESVSESKVRKSKSQRR